MSAARETVLAAGCRYEWADDWEVGSHVEEYPDAYDEEPNECLFVSLLDHGVREWAGLTSANPIVGSGYALSAYNDGETFDANRIYRLAAATFAEIADLIERYL